MQLNYTISADEVMEWLADDLSIPLSLAKLLNENGDIRSFLIKSVTEYTEQQAEYYLANEGYDFEEDAREYYQSIQREQVPNNKTEFWLGAA